MRSERNISSRSIPANFMIAVIVAAVLAAAGVTGLANDELIEKVFLDCRFAFMGEPPVNSRVDVDKASTEDETFVGNGDGVDESVNNQGPVFLSGGDATEEELKDLFKERAGLWVSMEELEKDSNGEVVIFDKGTVYIDKLMHASDGE